MKRKYDPEKVKLDAYERSIDEGVDYDKLKRPSSERKRKLKTVATATLKALKDTRANIRINGQDMLLLRKRAGEAGLPYQTFIAHVMHLYLTDQLVNVKEAKKLIEIGVFESRDRRKTGT